ncbi:CRISPR-associated helicase Cas3' [Thiolapillus sp.]
MIRPRKQGSSPALRQQVDLCCCLAKTRKTESGAEPGYTVEGHCRVVGMVARELLARLPASLQQNLFPRGSELVAASHDVGKLCPTFQLKILRAIKGRAFTPAELKVTAHLKENSWGGHPGVSQVTLEAIKAGRFAPRIVGLHHGYSPRVEGKLATDSPFGGNAWQKAREQLLENLKEELDCDWPDIASEEQARVIAGLTTVADWIGSGSFFEEPTPDWQSHITTAVDNAGFIHPCVKAGLGFEEIFGFPPRESQKQFYGHAYQPGVYILEAPMGMGKTEAALYAAYLALSRNHATGIYFALPTQLTSEKIHERVGAFLDAILSPDSMHRTPRLLHGNAWLKELEMGEEGQPGRDWFNARKRGILAPFAVGTIDQALMAVMNVRHGFVRAFGLAGKVVILDEVHSYDAYTGLLLDELVATLRRLQCTVIILSATLTAERRESLLSHPARDQAYPLVTTHPIDAESPAEIPVAGPASHAVTIQFQNEDQPALEEALRRAEQGQQILWIENTVKEVQQRHAVLAARAAGMGVECGLLHSRFTTADRQRNEDYWVALYGKGGGESRAQRGRILVGTQVLEQSLDIDADFLVSRIAPTDMVLQRLGRLWRHDAMARPGGARREAWLLTPALENAIEQPYQAFGDTAYVYAPYVLCRTLEVWQERKQVKLPEDIRSLIEATYEERPESEAMAQWRHELEHGNRFRKGRQQLRQLARVGLSYIGQTQSDDEAATRYSDRDSIDVLLLKSVRKIEEKQATLVTFLDGETLLLPHYAKSGGHRAWRQRAAALQRQQVKVAPEQAPDQVLRRSLHWLAPYLYLGSGDQELARLRVALVQADGELQGLSGGPASVERRITYDDQRGYRAEKHANQKEYP